MSTHHPPRASPNTRSSSTPPNTAFLHPAQHQVFLHLAQLPMPHEHRPSLLRVAAHSSESLPIPLSRPRRKSLRVAAYSSESLLSLPSSSTSQSSIS